jgi:hypothetical protein
MANGVAGGGDYPDAGGNEAGPAERHDPSRMIGNTVEAVHLRYLDRHDNISQTGQNTYQGKHYQHYSQSGYHAVPPFGEILHPVSGIVNNY